MKRKFAVIIFVMLCLAMIPIYHVNAEETYVCGINVSSDGTPISSPVLEAGKRYRIEAKTIFWYDYPANLAADAQYYTTDPSEHWQWTNYFTPNGHSFLQINGMDVDWGPFSNGDTWHTYSTYYIGTGEPITFQIVDWIDGDYSNNNCHLNVYIYESPLTRYGCTPGFWKNHPEAWPAAYSPNDSLQSIFGSYAPAGTLMNALRFKGGSGLSGAKQILARAAVAALLNAETFGSAYEYSTSELIDAVSYQFHYGTRSSILSLASDLDYWNNMGCPGCD